MATLSATSLRAQRRARSLRLRAGAARTFASLFAVFSGLVLGAIFLYDAFAHPVDRRRGAGPDRLGESCLLLACGFLSSVGNPIGGEWRKFGENLGAGNRGQILFFQYAPVMQFVSGGDVGKGPYRDLVFVGDAAALPGIAVQP